VEPAKLDARGWREKPDGTWRICMASQKPPPVYDDDMLCALEDALRQVWQVLKAHDPYPDWESDPDLKKALAMRLMALADSGIRDPQELRSRTLETFPLGRSH
jgi:hypothetical protein